MDENPYLEQDHAMCQSDFIAIGEDEYFKNRQGRATLIKDSDDEEEDIADKESSIIDENKREKPLVSILSDALKEEEESKN